MRYNKEPIEVKTNAPIYSKRIALLLNEQGLSQEDLAKLTGDLAKLTKDPNLTGVSKSSITAWIQGDKNGRRTEPKIISINAVAKALGVTVDYLIGNTDNPTVNRNLDIIYDYTGLSKESVELLHTHKNKQGFDILNSILESINFWCLLDRLYEYRNMAENAFSDEEWLSEGNFNRFNDIATTPQAKDAQFKLLQIQQLLNIQRLINLIEKDGANNG